MALHPEGEGQSTVECTLAQTVGALRQAPSLTVFVQVDPTVAAGSVLTNKAKMQGGGAPGAEGETSTVIDAPKPLLFGLTDLSDFIADPAGAPDVQSADHPASLTVMNPGRSIVTFTVLICRGMPRRMLGSGPRDQRCRS